MVFDLGSDVPAELGPLSWLIGVWEGTGVVSYRIGDDTRQYEFGQRIAFTHDGLPVLNYSAYAWRLDDAETAGPDEDDATGRIPLFTETGYWRLSRPLDDGDPGPAMLAPTAGRTVQTAEDVERYRTPAGFDVEALIVHAGGVAELYVGAVNGPRIDLATDAVMRSASAKEYSAATRLYGMVDSHLLWAWDISALGQDLRTHASGRLARAEH